MKPVAFLFTTAVATLALSLQPAAPQVITSRFDRLPIESGVYGQTVSIRVYASPLAPTGDLSLPVVYVPLVEQEDSALILRLEQMMQEGILPFMRIVTIERSGKVAPAVGAEPALYFDPKAQSQVAPSADAWFCRFLDSEVIQAVEGNYRCNSFRALYVDESSPLGTYLLRNPPRGFTAYLSPAPFVWSDGEHHSGPARTFKAYYSGLLGKEGLMVGTEKDGTPEEYFLKTRKPAWVVE
jgi:hypothetical protein